MALIPSNSDRAVPPLDAGAPRLRVRAGCGDKQLVTDRPVQLIGSRRDCSLPLTGDEVSSVHAALLNDGRCAVLLDLCSRTGLKLNGAPVTIARVLPGDRITLGGFELTVEADDERTAEAAQSRDRTLPTPPAALALLSGEQEHAIAALPAIIGRRNACRVVLDTPDTSLVHTLLWMMNDRPIVFDLGSRSGTILNGERVALAWLRDGDELRVGGEALTVRWSGPTFEGVRVARRNPASRSEPATRGDARPTSPALRAKPHEDAGLLAAIESLPADWQAALDELTQTCTRAEAHFSALNARALGQAALLGRREQSVAEREAALNQRAVDLDSRSREVEEQAAYAAQQAAETLRAQSALARAADSLQAQQAAIEQRSEELAELEQQLAARQAELESREQALVQQTTQIDQFRRVFSQVSEALAAPPTPQAAGTQTVAAPPPNPEPAQPAANTSPAATPRAVKSRRGVTPVVDRPLLGGAGSSPPLQ